MSIDWITVLAQLANFLVLVWLLKRFLYRPILDGIDAREAEITKSMAAAGEAQVKHPSRRRNISTNRKVKTTFCLCENSTWCCSRKQKCLLPVALSSASAGV
ncbi:MAG: hypothetical protein MH208_17135 [Marinobacter sp.]|nr:hypothetical protein [Marinobacter sp.]